MTRSLYHWSLLALLCALALVSIVWLSLVWSPVVNPDDPYILLRYLMLRLTAIAIAAPALTGLMIFVDFVTPNDWMKAIGDDAKACSIVMSAVILVIGAVLCWT
jgi:hypothetical protein